MVSPDELLHYLCAPDLDPTGDLFADEPPQAPAVPLSGDRPAIPNDAQDDWSIPIG